MAIFEILKRDEFWRQIYLNCEASLLQPRAQILTNQILSSQFSWHRETRQGCLPSPLIFALVIEPLAESIFSDPLIHGYNTQNCVNKISLYADDVSLIISQPQGMIPQLLDKINSFGNLSGQTGYRIIWNKSEFIPVHEQDIG